MMFPTTSTRPQRQRLLPSKYNDYTGLPAYLVNIAESVSSQVIEPQHFKHVVHVQEWCGAMNVELAALEANNIWELVPLPPHKTAVGCRWVYKVKYSADGKIDRYKARLVAKGYTQMANMDYFETFVPLTKMTSFCILLAIAVMHNWVLTQLDVTNAFLYCILEEEVYMSCPLGYTIPAHILNQFPNQKLVCHLLKSLHGLKQALRQWFIALLQHFYRSGSYKQLVIQVCLFFLKMTRFLYC